MMENERGKVPNFQKRKKSSEHHEKIRGFTEELPHRVELGGIGIIVFDRRHFL
jgi:hypothetical protein